jgi:chromosome segregation ATPase
METKEEETTTATTNAVKPKPKTAAQKKLDDELREHRYKERFDTVMTELRKVLDDVDCDDLPMMYSTYENYRDNCVEKQKALEIANDEVETLKIHIDGLQGRIAQLEELNNTARKAVKDKDKEVSMLEETVDNVTNCVEELDRFVASPYVQAAPQAKTGTATMKQLKRYLNLEGENHVS